LAAGGVIMKTTLVGQGKKQVPHFVRNDKKHLVGDDMRATWARGHATAGAAVWAGMAVLARMGIARIGAIELMFLFAPLVIVPLGMELDRVSGGTGWLEDVAGRVQPFGAACAVAAFWFPVGSKAAVAAAVWMGVCALMAGGGVMELGRLWRGRRNFSSVVAGRGAGAIRAVARIDLAVGGAWLVASRLGMRPMGIQEPIGLLTAVHFHFAGFATAMISASTLEFVERRGQVFWLRWMRPVVLMVVVMPIVVAVGFVISPALKMIAAVLFSMSVAALAVFVRGCGTQVEDGTARVLLQVAAGAVFAGMMLSGAYAVADLLGSDWLTIPQMARTHGILNGMGFCMMGLLGWLVEHRKAALGET